MCTGEKRLAEREQGSHTEDLVSLPVVSLRVILGSQVHTGQNQ